MAPRLTIARTALRLRLTYHQARALLLRGHLRGGLDENGHFYVDASDVERYAAECRTSDSRTERVTGRASGGR